MRRSSTNLCCVDGICVTCVLHLHVCMCVCLILMFCFDNCVVLYNFQTISNICICSALTFVLCLTYVMHFLYLCIRVCSILVYLLPYLLYLIMLYTGISCVRTYGPRHTAHGKQVVNICLPGFSLMVRGEGLQP